MSKICTICQTRILFNEPVTKCSRCDIEYHTLCWEENKGCAAYGCENTPEVMKAAGQQNNYDEKTCPFCKEKIKAFATTCPHCNKYLAVDPAIKDEKPVVGEHKTVIVLFVLSLLGILSPFTLIFSLWYYFYNKDGMNETNPLLRILLKFSIVISIIFIILFIVILKFKSKG
jgi:hypothetical protein